MPSSSAKTGFETGIAKVDSVRNFENSH